MSLLTHTLLYTTIGTCTTAYKCMLMYCVHGTHVFGIGCAHPSTWKQTPVLLLLPNKVLLEPQARCGRLVIKVVNP